MYIHLENNFQGELPMLSVGKREFTLNTSKYLKKVEETGEEIVITHQSKPTLRLIPIKPKTIKGLKGIITKCEVVGDINDPVFPGYDQW
jgi:prevent-host-death family protein